MPKTWRLKLALCPETTFRGARRRTMLILLNTSGIRLAEMAGLAMPDLSWAQGSLTVQGKGSKQRVAPFSRDAQRAVRRYLRIRLDGHSALWISDSGRPMAYGGVPKDLQRIFDLSGLRAKGLRDPAHIHRRAWAPRPRLRHRRL